VLKPHFMKTQLSAYVTFGLLLVSGCGAGQVSDGDLSAEQYLDGAKEDSARKQKHPEIFRCDTDADCVAVEQAGCCQNGYMAAVNGTEVEAYETTYACTKAQICPRFVVNDARVAQCDIPNHQCQMIDPSQIRCGGFIAPERQHSCPAGWTCKVSTIPDLPGTCVEEE
jgi:hypothetical protein